MHKLPPHTSKELAALIDQRDHLSVQISMEADQPVVDVERVQEMTRQLGLIEWRIQKERQRLAKLI